MLSQITEKRKFRNLRRLVDEAPPLQKAAIRWSARQLGPDNLAELEEGISRREVGLNESEAIRSHLHIRRIFSSATPQQKLALLWASHNLGSDKLAELDKLIERNEQMLGCRTTL